MPISVSHEMGAGMETPVYLGRTLGFAESRSPLWMSEAVDQGLPVVALDSLVALLSPEDDALRFEFVPRATLHRRGRTQRLSPEESARVARVASVFALAREVWGSDAEARDFLNRRHLLLEDRTPLSVALANDLGARLVEQILGRLHYGTAV
jgi:putative toxin-antitoxin system antitoxin component (TIGR02293 family)